MHTVNMRVTHNTADVPTLELFAFKDVKKAEKDLVSLPSVKECIILQTCNRVEIFAAGEDVEAVWHELRDYVSKDVIIKMKEKLQTTSGMPPQNIVEHVTAMSKKYHEIIETEFHREALRHLLRLTSGLESMIVGEDQVLGQVRDAYQLAKEADTVGPHFDNIFTKAINVGKVVRTRTKINKGAVSIGSAAVELAESVLGTLEGKDTLLIGAGEMGKLVTVSLKEKCLGKTYIANRTPEKAENLAEELGGQVLPFDKLEMGMKNSDLVISATAAPEPILNREKVGRALEGRKKGELVIIDVAIPRDVEDEVGKLKGVRLFNIDGLRDIANKNKFEREREAVKVEKIIEEELALLVKQVHRIDIEDVVGVLFQKAENIRKKELEKALKMMGNGVGEREKAIVDDLTRVIITKTVSPLADNVRRFAEEGNSEAINIAQRWFTEEVHHHRRRHVSDKKDEKA